MKNKREEQGRHAVHVDGIAIPGFNSSAEAQQAIDGNPSWKAKGAVPTKLAGAPKREVSGFR